MEVPQGPSDSKMGVPQIGWKMGHPRWGAQDWLSDGGTPHCLSDWASRLAPWWGSYDFLPNASIPYSRPDFMVKIGSVIGHPRLALRSGTPDWFPNRDSLNWLPDGVAQIGSQMGNSRLAPRLGTTYWLLVWETRIGSQMGWPKFAPRWAHQIGSQMWPPRLAPRWVFPRLCPWGGSPDRFPLGGPRIGSKIAPRWSGEQDWLSDGLLRMEGVSDLLQHWGMPDLLQQCGFQDLVPDGVPKISSQIWHPI